MTTTRQESIVPSWYCPMTTYLPALQIASLWWYFQLYFLYFLPPHPHPNNRGTAAVAPKYRQVLQCSALRHVCLVFSHDSASRNCTECRLESSGTLIAYQIEYPEYSIQHGTARSLLLWQLHKMWCYEQLLHMLKHNRATTSSSQEGHS